ncbi:MAG: hypothetical protein WBN92_04645 [Terriglobia bacterium]
MRSEDLAPAIVSLVLFLVAGYIVKIALQYKEKMRVIKVRTDLHTHLVERFGSAPEFVQFLQTDGGQHLLENITTEQSPAAEGILGSIQKGCLLTLLGLGLLLIGYFTINEATRHDALTSIYLVGGASLSLGIGYLISAAISYRLSKAWGLFAGAGLGKR